MKLKLIFLFCFFSLSVAHAQHGNILNNDTSICIGNPVLLRSGLIANGFSTASMDSIDDVYTPPINIGFPFTFYNHTYSQCLLSSNGYLSFDLQQATLFSPWSITAAIPSNSDPINCIMGPWQDIDPGVPNYGERSYITIGTAPNRRFVYSLNNIPEFSCNTLCATNQIVLYEGSNNIDIFVGTKPLCSTWNGGAAILGVQDSLGTTAAFPVGYNYPTQWTANSLAWHFAWNSSISNYNVTSIPYTPVPVNVSGVWYANGVQFSTSDTVTVYPTTTTQYVLSTNQCSTTGGDTITVTVRGVNSQVANVTPILCHGDTTGSFNYLIHLLHPPVNVYLNGSLIGHDTIYNYHGLTGGVFIFHCVDSIHCFSNDTVKLVNPSKLLLTINHIQNASCNGMNDGQIIFSVSGGTMPYTMMLNSTVINNNNQTTLLAGTYHISITDAHNCTTDTFITISQPPPFLINITSIQSPSCFGFNNGSVVVNVTPTSNYSFYVDGNLEGQNDTLKNLNGGTHIVRASLNASCYHDTTISIPQPPKFVTWINDSLDISCKGLVDGHFAISSTGGTPYYSYEIQKLIPSFITDSVFPNVPANHYTVYGRDAHGCLDTTSVYIAEPDSVLSKVITTDDASCYFKVDGKIIVNVYGGTRPYNVSVSSLDNTTYLSPTQVETGLYKIDIIDNHGCHLNDSAFIDVKCCLALLPNAFTPNNDGVDDVYRILNPGDFIQLTNFQIFNRWGQRVFQTSDKTQGWDGTYNSINQPVGVYMYEIAITCSKGRTLQVHGNVTLLR